MVAVALTAGHAPEAGMVLVTVYVPGVLAAKFTRPVAAVMLNPAVDVNVPAVPPPLNVGEGFAAFWQYGEAV